MNTLPSSGRYRALRALGKAAVVGGACLMAWLSIPGCLRTLMIDLSDASERSFSDNSGSLKPLRIEEVHIDDFGRAYDTEPTRAKRRWKDKVIGVFGQIASFKRGDTQTVVRLRGQYTSAQVVCVFPARTARTMDDIEVGEFGTIAGRFDGGKPRWIGSDELTLTDCFVPGRSPNLKRDAESAGRTTKEMAATTGERK